MKNLKSLSTIFASLVFALAACLGLAAGNASAESFSVSPMYEKIALTPGETYYGSLTVSNPGTSTTDFTFETAIEPFSADGEENSVKLEKGGDGTHNQITDWITIVDGTRTISPNTSRIVHYRIDVPADAPAGGQYAAIAVQSAKGTPTEGALNIQQQMRISYLIYADVAGETVHSGEISNVSVSSFLFSGNISATSTIKNSGNSHATAYYTLQVFPLFSNEEVYTNEEDPATALILPDATRLNTIEWENTPGMGIYKVIYNVSFEGETSTTEKLVIICPVWLLIVIFFLIFMIIFWLVSRSKSRKKSQS